MKTIEQHELKYWHIPKFNILPLIGIFIFTILAIWNYQLIDKNVINELSKSCSYDCEYNLNTHDLINIYPIIGEYILISLIIISFVAQTKGGYRKLKRCNKEGLIWNLIYGLIFGLLVYLIAGLIFGLILEFGK